MGRRHVSDPAQATHDPLTHEPARARVFADRKRYATSPVVPPGYAEYAAGGAKHVPPPPLGHHGLSARFQAAERLAGGRPAGASREEIAPKTAHWAKETEYVLNADPETLDGTLNPEQEAKRRSRENTESSIRFQSPPGGFEPRVHLPRRHPTDASIVITHSDDGGDFPRARGPVSGTEDASVSILPEPAPEVRRPFPPPRSTVQIGADGPSRIWSTHAEHVPRVSASSLRGGEARETPKAGAGGERTRVEGYHLITGAPRDDSRAAAAYEHHGARGTPVQDRWGKHGANGDPLLAMRSGKSPGTTPATYDIVTGGERFAAPAAFEHPGARRRNPGLAAMGAGTTRRDLDVANGNRHRDAKSETETSSKKKNTTPW
jgi:hypothetical protein